MQSDAVQTTKIPDSNISRKFHKNELFSFIGNEHTCVWPMKMSKALKKEKIPNGLFLVCKRSNFF